MSEIDDMDRRILGALQRDAGLSLDALSTRIGLSRNACWRRIRQMEGAGIITGRIATVDAAKLGFGLCVFMQVLSLIHI